ncbi:MAG TPA: Mrp/NBP35 family ATP-binding protein [Vicinamibacterales bacterium]|nr:Mrp/NBP35 family ATP-binding protein [Vicinamibacterales bacterium]
MATVTESAVLEALRAVKDPDLHKDIVALGFVKNLRIEGGRVGFTIELTTPACPVKDLMRDQARSVVAGLPGVSAVDIEMTAQVRAVVRPEAGRAPVDGVKNVIAVGAGKGGVGKTTVAVNLAVALAQRGSRVALLDGDMYGPNVPIMLGLKTQLETDGKKIVPAERYGLQVVSLGFLTQDDAPVIWRGPMLHGAIQQFFRDVRWNDVDYLIVDMPPGTGDVALSLSQTVPVAGAIVVTTPQAVSLADTRRAVQMYRKLNIPPIGLVENMSYFVCPDCGHESDVFGKGGGEQLATDMKVPFLGRIPLYAPVRAGGDAGVPIVLGDPESPPARALVAAAERVAQQVSIASFSRRAIPLVPVN